MKLNSYLFKGLIGYTVLLLFNYSLSSCSSEFDPDTAYKGKVDDRMLSVFSRGDYSGIILIEKEEKYYMDYEDFGTKNHKWEERLLDGEFLILSGKFYFHKNKALEHLSIEPQLPYGFSYKSYLAAAWEVYCQETGFDKKLLKSYQFEYDKSNKKLFINGRDYEIEKAKNNEIIISRVDTLYRTTVDNERIPSLMCKDIFFYKIENSFDLNLDKTVIYNNLQEACIDLCRIVRDQYGDTINVGSLLDRPNINLVLLDSIFSNPGWIPKDEKDFRRLNW